jgi:hypothetical protein
MLPSEERRTVLRDEFYEMTFHALLDQFAVPYVMSYDSSTLAPQHTHIASGTGRF